MAIVARAVRREERDVWRERIAALEQGVTYPLGADRFSLDHGEDYFAFFDRLGEVTTYVALDGERVVATGCGVLRQVPDGSGWRSAWYICDVKVHPDYRGRWVPTTMVLHAVPRYYPRCPRGYGISMNPSDGRENPVTRLMRRVPLVPSPAVAELAFFSLDATAMTAVAPLLSAARGPLSYLSLGGVKDIVLDSTGAPMPLWHVQHGPMAVAGRPTPVPGAVHMFCVPVGDALLPALLAEGVEVDATATVLAHRMGAQDYSFVLTSDI